jgi:hypothetical protein
VGLDKRRAKAFGKLISSEDTATKNSSCSGQSVSFGFDCERRGTKDMKHIGVRFGMETWASALGEGRAGS